MSKSMPLSAQLETFYLGTTRVEPDTHGYWIYVKSNRARFALRGSDLAKSIEEGRAISLTIKKDSANQGPLVYYRGKDGKIGIPPDPALVPRGVDRYEARTLAETDAVMKEMNLETAREWEDTGEWQAGLDQVIGDPRKHLASRLTDSISNRERDFVIEAIRELDHEQAERGRVTTTMQHRARNFGGY